MLYYVEALVAPATVNTLPPETFAAYRDHGCPAVRIQEGVATSQAPVKELAVAGIDLAAVTRDAGDEGIEIRRVVPLAARRYRRQNRSTGRVTSGG